jgi:hypothetical protein
MAIPLLSIFSTIGSAFGALIGFKKEQANVVNTTISTLGQIASQESETERSKGQVIVAEAQSGYWLAAVWRPLLMVFFGILIGLRWFGYMPPNMSEMELLEVYSLLKMGIGGYIGGRTIEKVISSLGLRGTIKKLIDKKVL